MYIFQGATDIRIVQEGLLVAMQQEGLELKNVGQMLSYVSHMNGHVDLEWSGHANMLTWS